MMVGLANVKIVRKRITINLLAVDGHKRPTGHNGHNGHKSPSGHKSLKERSEWARLAPAIRSRRPHLCGASRITAAVVARG